MTPDTIINGGKTKGNQQQKKKREEASERREPTSAQLRTTFQVVPNRPPLPAPLHNLSLLVIGAEVRAPSSACMSPRQIKNKHVIGTKDERAQSYSVGAILLRISMVNVCGCAVRVTLSRPTKPSSMGVPRKTRARVEKHHTTRGVPKPGPKNGDATQKKKEHARRSLAGFFFLRNGEKIKARSHIPGFPLQCHPSCDRGDAGGRQRVHRSTHGETGFCSGSGRGGRVSAAFHGALISRKYRNYRTTAVRYVRPKLPQSIGDFCLLSLAFFLCVSHPTDEPPPRESRLPRRRGLPPPAPPDPTEPPAAIPNPGRAPPCPLLEPLLPVSPRSRTAATLPRLATWPPSPLSPLLLRLDALPPPARLSATRAARSATPDLLRRRAPWPPVSPPAANVPKETLISVVVEAAVVLVPLLDLSPRTGPEVAVFPEWARSWG